MTHNRNPYENLPTVAEIPPDTRVFKKPDEPVRYGPENGIILAEHSPEGVQICFIMKGGVSVRMIYFNGRFEFIIYTMSGVFLAKHTEYGFSSAMYDFPSVCKHGHGTHRQPLCNANYKISLSHAQYTGCTICTPSTSIADIVEYMRDDFIENGYLPYYRRFETIADLIEVTGRYINDNSYAE
jgi:hypothetical protein